MNQLSIFDKPRHFPRARATDPSSSHEAADAMERSGRAKAQAESVLAALKIWANNTSAELAEASGIDRYAVGRRLSELVKAHLVDRILPGEHTVPCRVSGKRVCRWMAR